MDSRITFSSRISLSSRRRGQWISGASKYLRKILGMRRIQLREPGSRSESASRCDMKPFKNIQSRAISSLVLKWTGSIFEKALYAGIKIFKPGWFKHPGQSRNVYLTIGKYLWGLWEATMGLMSPSSSNALPNGCKDLQIEIIQTSAVSVGVAGLGKMGSKILVPFWSTKFITK